MSFSGSVQYSTAGALQSVGFAFGDFTLTYSITDANGNPNFRTLRVKGDGSGIFNSQGATILSAGTYATFLASLQSIVSQFDTGLQAAASAGKPVF